MSSRFLDLVSRWALPVGIIGSGIQYSMYNGKSLVSHSSHSLLTRFH